MVANTHRLPASVLSASPPHCVTGALSAIGRGVRRPAGALPIPFHNLPPTTNSLPDRGHGKQPLLSALALGNVLSISQLGGHTVGAAPARGIAVGVRLPSSPASADPDGPLRAVTYQLSEHTMNFPGAPSSNYPGFDGCTIIAVRLV